MANPNAKPHIVLILADNLGWGELGCYGGGVLRGAPTPHIDKLATEGLKFLNFNVESDCVPTRSALMTGRHPIRTGAMQSIPAGFPQGLVPWEVTLAQLLKSAGYATGCFGKWHLGDSPSRLPHARGFDEWYGIPRTSNESMFTSSPGYDPAVAPLPWIMEGRAGETARQVKQFDLEARRTIDGELVTRAIDFMQRNHEQPMFVYLPLTQLHSPTIPHRDFAGRSAAGEFGDSMMELDHRVGEIVAALDELGLRDSTMLWFGSDNGPEFRRPWRGTAGPWTGTYHTAMEGALRVPFMVRWPGQVTPGRETNEIVHVTDLYPTFAGIAGAVPPTDRPIDGVDQRAFFTNSATSSAREGFVYYIKNELRAVKWRDWKMHLIWESEPNAGTKHLETPWVFNLLQDPKEETDVSPHAPWVRAPMRRLTDAFLASLKAHPPIPPGAPDEFVPR